VAVAAVYCYFYIVVRAKGLENKKNNSTFEFCCSAQQGLAGAGWSHRAKLSQANMMA